MNKILEEYQMLSCWFIRRKVDLIEGTMRFQFEFDQTKPLYIDLLKNSKNKTNLLKANVKNKYFENIKNTLDNEFHQKIGDYLNGSILFLLLENLILSSYAIISVIIFIYFMFSKYFISFGILNIISHESLIWLMIIAIIMLFLIYASYFILKYKRGIIAPISLKLPLELNQSKTKSEENLPIYMVYANNEVIEKATDSEGKGKIYEMFIAELFSKIFWEILKKKANDKDEIVIPMVSAFMNPESDATERNEALYPLYMAIATFQKFKEPKQQLEINLVLLLRFVDKVIKVQKISKRTGKEKNVWKVYFSPEKHKRKYTRINLLKDALGEGKNKVEFKPPKRLEKILNNKKEHYLKGIKVKLDFNNIANLQEEIQGSDDRNGLGKPFNREFEKIESTYDDVPINEQAGIFIGLNVLEFLLRGLKVSTNKDLSLNIESNSDINVPDSIENGEFKLLQSGLGTHSFKVIKVWGENKLGGTAEVEAAEEKKEERPEAGDQTDSGEDEPNEEIKSGADYQSTDIVVEVKSRQPRKDDKSDDNLNAWISEKLTKAEKQVAYSLYQSQDEDNKEQRKNIGFVLSLYNPRSIKSGNSGKDGYNELYQIVEVIVLKDTSKSDEKECKKKQEVKDK
ncbi:MAG: hypothetical protein ACTSRZ_16240 [Promethearchaeota archaeon]